MSKENLVKKLDKQVISQISGLPLEAYEECINSDYITYSQDYSNLVSKKRLSMNDHGRIHMRKVTNYALQISKFLLDSHIELSGQKENWCSHEESLVAIILSSFLHDIGMGVHRQNHEFFSLILANCEIDRILNIVCDNQEKKYRLKCLIIESISGHMGHQKIASLEAGVLLVADGCDLEFGRANEIDESSITGRIGDIHSYSASCIKKVKICSGEAKPIKISVEILASAGFFQIEQVLMPKILNSPIKDYIEVIAFSQKGIEKKYL